MHRRIPMEQPASFFSNPNPRIRIPEVKMNNQESIKIRRTHFQVQRVSLNVTLPGSIARLEMRCARMVTPRRWIAALRTCIPALGNIIGLGRSMAVSAPRSGTDTEREEPGGGGIPPPRPTLYNDQRSALSDASVTPPRSCLDPNDSNITSH